MDPTADISFDPAFDDKEETVGNKCIHIRNQQRNGRKTVTSIQGLPEKINHTKVLKAIKKNFNCNGTVVDDGDKGKVIQVSGDQRKVIFDFLVEEGIAQKQNIKVHGV